MSNVAYATTSNCRKAQDRSIDVHFQSTQHAIFHADSSQPRRDFTGGESVPSRKTYGTQVEAKLDEIVPAIDAMIFNCTEITP